VKLVDANVLLYAVNTDSQHHAIARRWLDGALVGDETVGLPWLSLIAFTRLATHPAVFPAPLSVEAALDRVEDWLAAPAAVPCAPGRRHLELWREALREAGTGGNLVNDAHLAALAVENKAIVVTFDADFARFSGTRWRTPAQLLAD
jgi:toxin-antitoxin system PIN domain toxin